VDPRDLACWHRDNLPSPAERRRALAAAAAYLRCPVCTGPLHLGGRQLACRHDHSFDIARHGYVNLTAGRAGPGTGDTCAMVAARGRFLSRGHYQRLAAAVQSLAARHDPGLPGLVVDLAGGAGRSDVTSVNYQLSLDHADLSALVSMGPSARHITPKQLAARIGSLPSPFTVTVDLQVRVLHRRQDHAGARTTPRS
jgi:hypothetical protein